jgi:hypothetical protein
MPTYPWFRLYSNDLLSDRKLARVCRLCTVPKATVRGVWLTLMAMANDSPERGACLIAVGIPVSEVEICDDCGLDWETFDAILAEFAVLGMIERGECVTLPNFIKRNPPSDSSAERVRRYRARQKERDVTVTETLPSQPGNGIESESDPESDPDQESTATPSANADPPEKLVPSTFPEWQAAIKDSNNRQATIRGMIDVLYPGLDPPGYGYIVKVAGKVGGWGRLADLLWQHSTRPPTGDLLAYIQGVAKGRDNGSGKRKRETIEAPVIEWEKPDI